MLILPYHVTLGIRSRCYLAIFRPPLLGDLSRGGGEWREWELKRGLLYASSQSSSEQIPLCRVYFGLRWWHPHPADQCLGRAFSRQEDTGSGGRLTPSLAPLIFFLTVQYQAYLGGPMLGKTHEKLGAWALPSGKPTFWAPQVNSSCLKASSAS